MSRGCRVRTHNFISKDPEVLKKLGVLLAALPFVYHVVDQKTTFLSVSLHIYLGNFGLENSSVNGLCGSVSVTTWCLVTHSPKLSQADVSGLVGFWCTRRR